MKIKGKIYENPMSFSDKEWAILKKHYPFGGVSFILASEVEKEVKVDVAGRDDDDDKPNMKDYNVVKDMAMSYFREENWEKALYYLEAASKIKNFGWLNGKINQCRRNIKAELIAKPKI